MPKINVKNMTLKEKKNVALAMIAVSDIPINRKNRAIRAKKWLERRSNLGTFHTLVQELALEDSEGYRRYLRMDTATFEYLLEKVSPFITKKDTNMRKAISPAERLAVTLRFLATGETQSSLSFQFRIAQNTICGILGEVCDAIYRALQPDHMLCPSTEEEWKKVAQAFYKMWNFPFCIGAMDGKHVRILPPPGSGSAYRNYKGTFSIVLLALVGANLEFLYIDVGTNGRISDGGVWAKCSFKLALEQNLLNLPEASNLPGTTKVVPYVIVADDAFPLTTRIMKPYPGKNLSETEEIFNYRLSRARRVSENAFGLLAVRFRFLHTTLDVSVNKAVKYVLASCCLHNLLCKKSSGYAEGAKDMACDLLELESEGLYGNSIAKQVRENYKAYFNGSGKVAWQHKMRHEH